MRFGNDSFLEFHPAPNYMLGTAPVVDAVGAAMHAALL